MSVRRGTETDAAAAAELHARCITTGFLSELGPAFLTPLYRRVARDPHAFLLVADNGADLVGMAAVVEDVRRFYRTFLARDGVSAALRSLPRLARSSRRVLETLRYPSSTEAALPAAELLAIAVAPGARGSGLGAALLEAAHDELRARGIRELKTVMGLPNDEAGALYHHAGYVPAARTTVHRGTESEVLVWRAPV